MKNKNLKNGVSIVLCCFNSSQVISDTVIALSNQIVEPSIKYEILLIDNNCSDNTVELAQNNYLNKKAPLRVIKEEKTGLINARKRGILNANYNIIGFVDDDNILCDYWINKVYSIFKKNKNIGVVGGFNEPIIDGVVPDWFYTFQKSYACGRQNDTSGYVTKNKKFVFGAGFSFRTHILLEIIQSESPVMLQGRTKNYIMSGEDEELCLKAVLMGWEIWYEESLKLRHKINKSKLSWNYLCSLQESFSDSSIVLNIYRNIIEGKKTDNLLKLVFKVFKHSLAFLFRTCRKDKLKSLVKEGSSSMVELYQLKGLIKGTLHHFTRYTSIRRSIISFYSNYNGI